MQDTFESNTPLSGQEDFPIVGTGNAPLTDQGDIAGSSLEEWLLMKMDRAVEAFADIMGDASFIQTETERGTRNTPRYTFAERMKAAEFCRDWILRRRKIQAPTDGTLDAPNIESLKDAMRQVSLETMKQQRVVTLSPKKNGRPTKAEAAARRLEEEHVASIKANYVEPDDDSGDDNELRNALGKLK